MMKVDVVDYVLNRQEQICAILRDEMHKDQQIMSQHMQENYLSSLNHILVNELLPKLVTPVLWPCSVEFKYQTILNEKNWQASIWL